MSGSASSRVEPYYMAQAIVVQEQALEAQIAQSQQRGSFFSSMFGSNTAPQRQAPQQSGYGRAAPGSPWGNQNQAFGQPMQ
ncbi:hypothetical protein D9M69_68610 [compost metagenome]